METPSLTPLANKVILITGAARGIGLAIARYAAARGAAVSIADVAAPMLQESEATLKKDFPRAMVSSAVVDVSKREDVDKWVADCKEKFGKIDGCVNNAGTVGRTFTPIANMSDEEWNFVMGVNLDGVFNCLRAEMGAIAEGGSIVNVSSVAGLYGFPALAGYVTSKHAVLGLTKCAAREGATRGVRVNAICPGAIDTPMIVRADEQAGGGFKASEVPQVIKRYGTPTEIAALVCYLLGDESKFTTSSTYAIDGGWG